MPNSKFAEGEKIVILPEHISQFTQLLAVYRQKERNGHKFIDKVYIGLLEHLLEMETLDTKTAQEIFDKIYGDFAYALPTHLEDAYNLLYAFAKPKRLSQV